MLGIFGDRSGSPVADLEHSRALTSARALRSHAPWHSCAIRIEGGWLMRCRPRDRSLALTSPGGFRRVSSLKKYKATARHQEYRLKHRSYQRARCSARPRAFYPVPSSAHICTRQWFYVSGFYHLKFFNCSTSWSRLTTIHVEQERQSAGSSRIYVETLLLGLK
jgi:hypothetical protein